MRFTNPEPEARTVMKGLAKVKWLILSLPYPMIVYSYHQSLKTRLTGPWNDSHRSIANWQQQLSEYDRILVHRRANTHCMAIADGMSQLPSCLMGKVYAEDVIGLDANIDWGTNGGRDAEENGNLEVRSARRVGVRNEVQAGGGNEILEEGVPVLR